MDERKIEAAMAEAKRFLQCAEAALTETSDGFLYAGKRSGALRRASMDLTRSLADLRGRAS